MTPAEKRLQEILDAEAARGTVAAPPPRAPTTRPPKADTTRPTASKSFRDAISDEAKGAKLLAEKRAEMAGKPDEEIEKAGAEAKAEVKDEREEQRLATPVTFGGERAPSLLGQAATVGRRLAENAQRGAGFLADMGSALLPQSLETEAQKKQRAEAETPTVDDLARLAAYGRGAAEKLAPLATGTGLDTGIRLADLVAAHVLTPEQAAERTKLVDSAAAVESPAAYALRLAAVPQSIVAGVGEAATTDRDVWETVPDRIRGGEGLTGAGAEAGRAVGRRVGAAVQDVTGAPIAGIVEEAGAVQGGLAGLAGDVAVGAGVDSVWRATVGRVGAAVGARLGAGAGTKLESEALHELRELVNGIPQLHMVDARALATAREIPVPDASAWQLARVVAGDAAATGVGFVRSLAAGLGREVPAEALEALAARAEPLVAAEPTAGIGAQLDELAGDVAKAAGLELAPGDARRALGTAFTDTRTFDLVRSVVSQLPESARVPAQVTLEAALGPEKYLAAIQAKSPELAKAIREASGISPGTGGNELAQRAEVSRRLEQFNRAIGKGPAPVRRAWSMLQSTMGYGTPIIGPEMEMQVDKLVAGVASGANAIAGNAMRSGMLSGFMVPNPRFFVNNFVTAPAIVYSTLGPRYAAAAVLSMDSLRVMRAMAGAPGAEVLVRAGEKTYTARDIARLAVSRGLTRSQATAELGAAREALVEFAQRASDGRFLSHVKSLGGYGHNIWAGAADASDNFFRINVLTRALREGASETEAVKMARAALFDYGATSKWEKTALGSAVWFWTFRRNNYLTLFRGLLENPGRVTALASVNNAWSGARPRGDDATFLATVGYAENAPMWRMVSDPAVGMRYAMTGPPIPLVQAAEDIVGALQQLWLAGEDFERDRGGFGTQAALERIGGAALSQVNNPFWGAAATMVHGTDLQGDLFSRTPDPAILWYLAQLPGGLAAAMSMFDLEEVPVKEAKAAGIFLPEAQSEGGSGQYRFRSKGGAVAWQLMLAAASVGGAQRALREYAPLLSAMKEGATGEADVVAPKLGNAEGQTYWDRLRTIAGLSSAVTMPDFEQTPARNRAVREGEILSDR